MPLSMKRPRFAFESTLLGNSQLIQCIPHGGYRFVTATSRPGGTNLAERPGSVDGVNVLEVQPVGRAVSAGCSER